jgi:hypothetical protein
MISGVIFNFAKGLKKLTFKLLQQHRPPPKF